MNEEKEKIYSNFSVCCVWYGCFYAHCIHPPGEAHITWHAKIRKVFYFFFNAIPSYVDPLRLYSREFLFYFNFFFFSYT